MSAPLLGQSTWFVDAGAPGPGSGSQSDPYASIQHAIDQPATTSGDRILVLPGLYFEKVDFLAKELQIESSAGAQATRINPLADGPVVRVVGGQNSGTQLTGFTLSGGTGENFSGQTRGGAVYLANSNLTLLGCVVKNNVSMGGGAVYVGPGAGFTAIFSDFDENEVVAYGNLPGAGGAVFVFEGNARLEDCRFRENFGQYSSTIVGTTNANLDMLRCEIRGNTPDKPGYTGTGGVNGTGVSLVDCLIVDNDSYGNSWVGGFGGSGTLLRCTISDNVGCGVIGSVGQSLELAGCTIRNNVGPWDGPGGVYRATLDHCEVSGNRGGYGGGITLCDARDTWMQGNTAASLGSIHNGDRGGGALDSNLVRCTVIGNEARHGGGVYGGSLRNCTVVGNHATELGGGLMSPPTAVVKADQCIIWGNTPSQIQSAAVAWSIIEGGYAGEQNSAADPKFVLPFTAGDVHLSAASPAIDGGNPGAAPDGDGSIADLGAWPFDPAYCPNAVYCTPSTDSNGCIAQIEVLGTASASQRPADDLHIAATRVRNQTFGILIWSRGGLDQGAGLCVQAPIVRRSATFSGGSLGGVDCSGILNDPFSQAELAMAGLQAGDSLYAQWWIRDGPGPGVFSNAAEITLCP